MWLTVTRSRSSTSIVISHATLAGGAIPRNLIIFILTLCTQSQDGGNHYTRRRMPSVTGAHTTASSRRLITEPHSLTLKQRGSDHSLLSSFRFSYKTKGTSQDIRKTDNGYNGDSHVCHSLFCSTTLSQSHLILVRGHA